MIKKQFLIFFCSLILLCGCVPVTPNSEVSTKELNDKTEQLFISKERITSLEEKVKKLEAENKKQADLIADSNIRLESYLATIGEKEAFIKKLIADNSTSPKSDYLLDYYKSHFLPTIEATIAKETIKETSDAVINLLANKDFEGLSEYVHPFFGIRFTPYTTVSLDEDLVVHKDDIKSYLDDSNKYIWGIYDGVGGNIELTKKDYYDKFVYTHDYLNAKEIGYNEAEKRVSMNLSNQYAYYHDSIIVEYLYEGTEKMSYLDASSLRLVFQKYNDKWYLVGLINNVWTI